MSRMGFIVITAILLLCGDVSFAYAMVLHANQNPSDPAGTLAVAFPFGSGVASWLLGVLVGLSGFLVTTVRACKYAKWTLLILVITHGIPLLVVLVWMRATLG